MLSTQRAALRGPCGSRCPRSPIRPLPTSRWGLTTCRGVTLSSQQVLGIQKPRLSYVGVVQAGDGMSSGKATWGQRLDGLPPPPPISKPDAHFEGMGLQFVDSLDGIKITELNELFEKVGFPRRDPDRLKVALDNTYRLIWIRSTKQSRLARMGQLIGFARATSDGEFSATIWDVAVSPAWQRSGLGRAMIERLMRELVADGLATITLYAEPGVVGLYKKLGFLEDPEGIRGMAFQRRKGSGSGSGGSRQNVGAGGRAAVAAVRR